MGMSLKDLSDFMRYYATKNGKPAPAPVACRYCDMMSGPDTGRDAADVATDLARQLESLARELKKLVKNGEI